MATWKEQLDGMVAAQKSAVSDAEALSKSVTTGAMEASVKVEDGHILLGVGGPRLPTLWFRDSDITKLADFLAPLQSVGGKV